MYRSNQTEMTMSADNTPEEDTPRENLAILAEYRAKNVRASEEVVRRGERVLKTRGQLKRMGDEGELVKLCRNVSPGVLLMCLW